MQIPEHCIDCYHGRYEVKVKDYSHPLPDGTTVMVPRVVFLRCAECGEELIPIESEHYIFSYATSNAQSVGVTP